MRKRKRESKLRCKSTILAKSTRPDRCPSLTKSSPQKQRREKFIFSITLNRGESQSPTRSSQTFASSATPKKAMAWTGTPTSLACSCLEAMTIRFAFGISISLTSCHQHWTPCAIGTPTLRWLRMLRGTASPFTSSHRFQTTKNSRFGICVNNRSPKA
jgi:hypothetical protein